MVLIPVSCMHKIMPVFPRGIGTAHETNRYIYAKKALLAILGLKTSDILICDVAYNTS